MITQAVVVASALGLAVGVIVTAGGGETGSRRDADSGVMTTSGGEHTPARDVTVTACRESEPYGWPLAELTVTNGWIRPADYLITVQFFTRDGDLLDAAYASATSLRPGQSTYTDAQGLTTVLGTVVCRVTAVQRIPHAG